MCSEEILLEYIVVHKDVLIEKLEKAQETLRRYTRHLEVTREYTENETDIAKDYARKIIGENTYLKIKCCEELIYTYKDMIKTLEYVCEVKNNGH